MPSGKIKRNHMIKRSIIALSTIAALSTNSFASNITNDEMMKQIEMLKAQITALENKLNETTQQNKETKTLLNSLKSNEKIEKRLKKVEKKLARTNKKLNIVKAHDAADNIKWNVDLRTTVDNIKYTHASGKESKNSSFMTNRLWLDMGYAPSDNIMFKGRLSYNKAFGDSANHAQANTNPMYANFDWVTNENALDNTLKVKEAYWLYMNDTFLGTDISWTASLGRRPSTDGIGINYREDQARKSAYSHIVNVEFDAASFRWNLDKVTPLTGSWIKLCMGKGLTNATPRFSFSGTDYAKDLTQTSDIDMGGLIFIPYDDGQYSIHTKYTYATNMIGFDAADLATFMAGGAAPSFKDQGSLELMTGMLKIDGIGNEINDFLDDTIFFASFAQSKTKPANGKAMLGSTKSETGHSTWLGVQFPCLISDDGRIGIEWNKGSKYWRPVTYAEDTVIGSKIATRGTAWEVYYHKPLTKALSMSLRYTNIKYDYTGSNSFFGADGAPMTMAQAQAMGQDPVEKASDIRAYIRYRF
jgi:archaellum component FlaC